MITRECCSKARWLFAIYKGPDGPVQLGPWEHDWKHGRPVCIPRSEIDNPLFEVDAPGTRLSIIFRGYGARGCNPCKKTAAKMDRMGSAWCRKHADELIAEIRRNIKNLGWWRRLQVAAAEGAGIVDIEECFWRAVNPASPETASPQ